MTKTQNGEVNLNYNYLSSRMDSCFSKSTKRSNGLFKFLLLWFLPFFTKVFTILKGCMQKEIYEEDDDEEKDKDSKKDEK